MSLDNKSRLRVTPQAIRVPKLYRVPRLIGIASTGRSRPVADLAPPRFAVADDFTYVCPDFHNSEGIEAVIQVSRLLNSAWRGTVALIFLLNDDPQPAPHEVFLRDLMQPHDETTAIEFFSAHGPPSIVKVDTPTRATPWFGREGDRGHDFLMRSVHGPFGPGNEPDDPYELEWTGKPIQTGVGQLVGFRLATLIQDLSSLQRLSLYWRLLNESDLTEESLRSEARPELLECVNSGDGVLDRAAAQMDPITGQDCLDVTSRALNDLVDGRRIGVGFGPEPEPPFIPELVAFEIVRFVSDSNPLRVCVRESCGQAFVRHKGRAKAGQHRIDGGVTFCSAACSSAATSKAHRDRERNKRSSG